MNKNILESIREKKAKQEYWLSMLEKREALIEYLRAHGIRVGKNSSFKCAAIGRAGMVIAVKVDGVEHPLDQPIPKREWFSRYVP
jgi:hypothetical protein